MQLKQIIDLIGNHFILVVVALTTLIQIAPIKIDPWSALFKWIGKMVTNNACSKIDGLIVKVDTVETKLGTVDTKIGNLETNVSNLEVSIDANEKDRIRWEILDFANSCRNNRKHSRDEFQHIVDLNDKYKRLLAKTKDSNGVFDIEFKYIKDLYEERLAKNDFL